MSWSLLRDSDLFLMHLIRAPVKLFLRPAQNKTKTNSQPFISWSIRKKKNTWITVICLQDTLLISTTISKYIGSSCIRQSWTCPACLLYINQFLGDFKYIIQSWDVDWRIDWRIDSQSPSPSGWFQLMWGVHVWHENTDAEIHWQIAREGDKVLKTAWNRHVMNLKGLICIFGGPPQELKWHPLSLSCSL